MNKRIRKKKGLSKITNEECYDLVDTLTKFILPRLYKFKEINVNSYPCNLSGIEEWHSIIDKMIWSLEFKEKTSNKNWFSYSKEDKDLMNKKYDEGMLLFAKYYHDLWD